MEKELEKEVEKEETINTEIEDMLNALDGSSSNKAEEENEKEKTKEEDKTREEEKKEKEEEENPEDKTKESAREEKEEEEETEEDEQIKADIEKKEREVLDKINVEREERKRAEEEARVKAEKEAKERNEPVKIEEQDFIGDVDLEELIENKKAFNKLLNSVYAKGVSDSNKLFTEKLFSSIPDIVRQNLISIISIKETSDKFYKENEDLVPFKKVVAAVFDDVAANNPDRNYNELMNLVAPEARKRLGLKRQVATKQKDNEDRSKAPKLHGPRNTQRQSLSQKKNLSSLESEISEMNKSLGR
jgi:hypothetical protein